MRTPSFRLSSAPSRAIPWTTLCLGALAALLASAAMAAAAPTWANEGHKAGVVFFNAGEMHPPDGLDNTWPAFPEIMGGGVCWVDVDNDGYDDLYMVNQQYNDANPFVGLWAANADTRNRLFINNGNGTFRDATDGSGADHHGWGYGCSAADYDADGCMDLFVTNFGPSQLFRGHCDGTFEDASAALGVVAGDDACGDFTCFSTSSAWADYDRDGFLDVYVANYVESSSTDNIRGPNGHTSQYNFLLHNNGDGTFSEVARQVGAAGRATDADGSKSLGVAWLDYDLDGDLDLFVTNDQTPDDLFRNNGDGTFTQVASSAGIADQQAGMGVSAGDYDNDGDPDLFFTHYKSQENGFYENKGDGTFADRSGEDGLHSALDNVGWGARFVDVDRDGWLDIVAGNGHTEWIDANYAQSLQVWRNDAEPAPTGTGDRRWVDVSADSGAGIAEKKVHRALAFGDYDFDGNVDIATVNNANATAQLLHGAGNANHWLYLELRQPGNDRLALGARVKIEAAGLPTQWREVQSGQSYLSQSALRLDVGLGNATQADTVTVFWPQGGSTVVHDIPAGRVARILRATGSVVLDTLSPLTNAVLDGEGQLGWFRGPVEVTLDATDRAVGGDPSGVALTEWRLDGGAWQTGTALTVTGDGIHTLQARSRDAAGNQEPARTTVVRIDTGAPLPLEALDGTLGLDGWYVSPQVGVKLASSDPLSGPGAIRYRLDGGAWQAYDAPFAVADDGSHDVAFVVADVAGNEASDSFTILLDHTTPDGAFQQPLGGSAWVAGAPVARIPADRAPVVVVTTPMDFVLEVAAQADDAASGLAGLVLRLDGADVARADTGDLAWSWDTRTSAAGLHVLELVATDVAGNTQTAVVRVVLVPAHPDSVAVTLEDGPSVQPGPLPVASAMADARRR